MILHVRSRIPPLIVRTGAISVVLMGVLIGLSGPVESVHCEGLWDAQICLDGVNGRWEVEQELTVAVVGTGWDVKGAIELDPEGWDDLELEGSCELSSIDLASKLSFDAGCARFKKWTADLSLGIGGLDSSIGLDLYRNHCWVDLQADAESERFGIGFDVRLGASKAYCLDFYRCDIEVAFETCGIPIDIEGRFSAKKRFEWIDIETIVPLPLAVDWMEIEVDTRWTTAGKDLSLEPELVVMMIRDEATASAQLFAEIVASGTLGLEGLSIVGGKLDLSWDGLWFENSLSFVPARNKKITGIKKYGWVAGMGYEADGTCDRGIAIEAWAYAKTASAWPHLAWSLTLVAEFDKPWEVTLDVFVEAGCLSKITAGVEVEW